MPVRLCSRCHGDLSHEVTGDILYCPHCGAPQVMLSEELREQFEQQQLAAVNPPGGADSDKVVVAPVSDPAAILWPQALQLIALGGAVFVVLMLVTLAFPPLALLPLLWLLTAPIVLLGIYATRYPKSRVSPRFGARFGLLTGGMIGLAGLLIFTLQLLLMRFVMHQGGVIDQRFTEIVSQLSSPVWVKSFGADQAAMQQIKADYGVPEFRAGMCLVDGLLTIGLYSLYTTVSGAFSGLLRSRSHVRR